MEKEINEFLELSTDLYYLVDIQFSTLKFDSITIKYTAMIIYKTKEVQI